MDRVDLHAHTNRSDGSLTPQALVTLAKEVGLRALAVTDHDTTAALPLAREVGASLGVEILTGIEITARFPGRAMHVLAYGFDENDRTLKALLAEIIGQRDARNPKILQKLADAGCPLTMEEVRAQAAGSVIARPHIARAMVARGYVSDLRSAFQQYLKDGGPAFVPAETVEPAEVVAVVRAAGGVSVVAHPRQLRIETPDGYRAVFRDLAAAGLGGIEVLHPSHNSGERQFFGEIASRLGLVASGGSDFHGDAKPDIRLGVGDGSISIGYETWEALRARCAALSN
jgi:predicted metal-dependent phosphoesterase TrpH